MKQTEKERDISVTKNGEEVQRKRPVVYGVLSYASWFAMSRIGSRFNTRCHCAGPFDQGMMYVYRSYSTLLQAYIQ